MVILPNGWELHSWEMSHSPKHFYEITSLFSASCPFGKLSVRQNVRSAKCPFGKTSVRQNVRRQNVRSAKCLSAKCLSAKCLSAKCPGTILFSRLSVEICFLELHCYHFKTRNSRTILRENRNKIVEYFDSDSLLHLFILINFPAVFLDISNIYCYRKL
jgi:hypothetical protein